MQGAVDALHGAVRTAICRGDLVTVSAHLVAVRAERQLVAGCASLHQQRAEDSPANLNNQSVDEYRDQRPSRCLLGFD